jgi:hypothetical protein
VDEKSYCSFLEPHLNFELVRQEGGAVDVRVLFQLKTRPPWLKHPQDGEDPYLLNFSLAPSDLKTAADNLEGQLRRFPERASL